MEKSLLNPDVGSSRAEAHFHHACDPNKSEAGFSGSQGQLCGRRAQIPVPPSHILPGASEALPGILQCLCFLLASLLSVCDPTTDRGSKKEGPLLKDSPEFCMVAGRIGALSTLLTGLQTKQYMWQREGLLYSFPPPPSFFLPPPPPSFPPFSSSLLLHFLPPLSSSLFLPPLLS